MEKIVTLCKDGDSTQVYYPKIKNGCVDDNEIQESKLSTQVQAKLNKEVYSKLEVQQLLAEKQNLLVSGQNIKTINNESLLGQGNISVEVPDIYINNLNITGGVESTYNTQAYIQIVSDAVATSVQGFRTYLNKYSGTIELNVNGYHNVNATGKYHQIVYCTILSTGIVFGVLINDDVVDVQYGWNDITVSGSYIKL